MLTVNSSSFCILLQARHLGAGPLFFFFNSRAQTCWFLLPRSFERSSCIISFLVLLVPFYTSGFVEWLSRNFQQQTRPRYQLKTADATDYCSPAVDICKVMSIYVFRLKSYVPLTRAGVIIRENFHPGYRDLSLASHMNASKFLRRKEWRGEISENDPARLTGLIWKGPETTFSTHEHTYVMLFANRHL